MDKDDKKDLQNRAAAYVRMSTEHQQYSTSNQMDVILEYAKRRGLEIVKIYSDEGKNGLNIEGREALSQMLDDVQSGRANFSCILVYDVSRWGRFQDADESAHYEYTCRIHDQLGHAVALFQVGNFRGLIRGSRVKPDGASEKVTKQSC